MSDRFDRLAAKLKAQNLELFEVSVREINRLELEVTELRVLRDRLNTLLMGIAPAESWGKDLVDAVSVQIGKLQKQAKDLDDQCEKANELMKESLHLIPTSETERIRWRMDAAQWFEEWMRLKIDAS